MRRMEDGKPEIDVAEVHAAGSDWERYYDGGETLWWFGAVYHGGPVSTLEGVEWSGPIPTPEAQPDAPGARP